MVRTLGPAIAEIAGCLKPTSHIGHKLLTHVEKLKVLRTEIDKGIRSRLRTIGAAVLRSRERRVLLYLTAPD